MITPAITVLGAVEGLKVATPVFDALRRADHRRHPDRRLRDPAARHRPRRPSLRSGHGASGSLCIARARRPWLVDAAGRADGGRSAPRRARSSPSTAGTASPCSARCSWSSPAARRCTPTWGTSASAPIRLAWFALVLPALLLNYFGQGALLLADPEAAAQPVLPAGAGVGAAAAGRAGHGRRDHRLAGAHLRRVLADAPGDAARLLPAPRHRPHVVATRSGQVYVPQVELGADGLHDRDRRSASARRRALAAAYGIAVTLDDGDHGGAAARRGAPSAGTGRRPLAFASPACS